VQLKGLTRKEHFMKTFHNMDFTLQKEASGPSLRQVPSAFWTWLILLGGLLVVGWWVFLFTTDDAYIAFRYISNSILGRGYTWNPPPFRPVEGYTSFMWVILLELIWRLFGVEPPDAANVVALLFSFGTFFYTALLGLRMRLPGTGITLKSVLVAIALLGVVTNRTFLAWTSSGLETAMFNFFVIAWIYHMLNPGEKGSRWLLVLGVLSALIYFSRPDGLLFVLCTVFISLTGLMVKEVRGRDLLYLFPLLAVPAHFLWRRLYYGAWLPNTYYAKHVAAWPESGVRYLASFALEYSFWILLPLVLYYIWKRYRQQRAEPSSGLRVHLPALAAVGTVCVHIGYYTFIIGGDHFEYRVYSYLVPLLFVGAAYLVGNLASGKRWAVIALCVLVLASYPIPWTHWYATKDVNTREEQLFRPVVPYFPAFVRGYVGLFDSLQNWLISHYVGLRHQEHKELLIYLKKQFADKGMTRANGMKIPWEPGHPVTNQRIVGYIGWMFPNVAIIDTAGLNDYVVARTPTKKGKGRYMAHERQARWDYLDCFKGVEYLSTKAWQTHLTDDEIRACEKRWWKWADSVKDKAPGSTEQ
jgi:arabinofuranosyltransferase